MREIGDDPIVRCMERTGYPPWFARRDGDFTERDAEALREEIPGAAIVGYVTEREESAIVLEM